MLGFLETFEPGTRANNHIRTEPLGQVRPLAWLREQALWGTPIWAVCSKCDHSTLMDAADLLTLTRKEGGPLAQLSERMRCRACGSKACELHAATPIPEYAQ